jgi:hypothetical protein
VVLCRYAASKRNYITQEVWNLSYDAFCIIVFFNIFVLNL